MKRVFKTLKNYLIPGEGNDHRPHLLRPQAVVFVIAVALVVESIFLFGASYVAPRSRLFGLIVANALIDGTNAARAADNLTALHENPLLDAAAQDKANDMVANNYFAHTSPAGLTPWYWFEKVGYPFSSAGENLAVNFADSADVTNAWLNSPEHRVNILNAGFTEIGMATAQGTFNGVLAVYVVELFGAPSAAPIALANNAKPTAAAVSVPQPAFVAVKGATTQTAPAAAVAAVPTPSGASNFVQTAAADPRRTVDYIYLAIAILFAAALLVNIFVKIRIQHPQVILGGMLVILIAGLFIVLNQHFGSAGTVVL